MVVAAVYGVHACSLPQGGASIHTNTTARHSPTDTQTLHSASPTTPPRVRVCPQTAPPPRNNPGVRMQHALELVQTNFKPHSPRIYAQAPRHALCRNPTGVAPGNLQTRHKDGAERPHVAVVSIPDNQNRRCCALFQCPSRHVVDHRRQCSYEPGLAPERAIRQGPDPAK
jgi:hypothetical protein